MLAIGNKAEQVFTAEEFVKLAPEDMWTALSGGKVWWVAYGDQSQMRIRSKLDALGWPYTAETVRSVEGHPIDTVFHILSIDNTRRNTKQTSQVPVRKAA